MLLAPTTFAEALDMLADSNGAAIPMAGGTDLLVHWPQLLGAHDRTHLDLSGISGIDALEWTDTDLVLGALTTYWDVICDDRAGEEFPLLATAARQVGAIQIQARGTWAGNIMNASPAADGVPVLMAYDAVVVLESSAGREEVPLAEFYAGYKKPRCRPEQLVRAIRIPRRVYDFEAFVKVGSRAASAITKVGVALSRSSSGWHVVANSVAPTVRRCPHVERFLDGRTPGSPTDLIAPIRRDVAPIDDLRSTAAYREAVLARIIYHAVGEQGGS